MSTEAAILKNLFPPAGAIPPDCIDRIDKIRGHIKAAIELAAGGSSSSLGRISHPASSEALTLRIVALKESPEGAALCWREIGARIGITADAASKRYQKFCKTREAEELRREGYGALSGDATLRNVADGPKIDSREHFVEADEMIAAAAQDGKKQEMEHVPGRAELLEPSSTDNEKATLRDSRIVEESEKVLETRGRKNPKIPHTEDEFIDRRRAEGAKYSGIMAELNARGIACNVDDVIARHHDYRKKREREAAGKKPHNAPTTKEDAVLQQQTEAGPEEADSKPEPKSIARAELDARIWAAWKAGKTPDEISDELYAEGLYYSEKSVRVRLISQGADL